MLREENADEKSWRSANMSEWIAADDFQDDLMQRILIGSSRFLDLGHDWHIKGFELPRKRVGSQVFDETSGEFLRLRRE